MKKIAYLLSVYLFCLLPKLQAQDIDFPLSLSEIEKYESRIRIQRLPAVTITHADAYKTGHGSLYILLGQKRLCLI